MTGLATPDSGAGAGRLLIGDVTHRTGLSLRTVRYYEEVGLVLPISRTDGGFRLYDEDAIERLEVIKRMKPLGFTVEEMRTLLGTRQRLAESDLPADERQALVDQLDTWAVLADSKLRDLQRQVAVAESFVQALHRDRQHFAAQPHPG